MITLKIDNSLCQITGISTEQYADLRKILSYKPDPMAARYAGFRGNNPRYLIDKKGQFPTGLLYLVEVYLSQKRIEFVTQDKRIKPSRQFVFDMAGHPKPYPEQAAAASHAVLNSRGIIAAPTGVGKSLICALLIQSFGVKTLIVVPTLELKRQLSQSLLEWFGAISMKHITVQNVDALDPNKEAAVDLVIIDEFHHSGAATYRKLNQKAWKNVYYKIGLTATPFRSQDHERLLLESVLSKVIYRIEYQDAVAKGYIVPLEAYYVDVPISEVNSNSWPAVYSKLVVNNVTRNRLIAQLINQLWDAKISTLCLVKEIRHGEILSNITGAGFANGESDETPLLIKGFNEGKLTSLIGTTGVLGEGVDTKPAEYIIIAGLGKSKNAFMQACGRGFRKYGDKQSCKIIIFRDKSHKWTLTHFKAQCKILLEEYRVIPVRLEL